MKRYKLFDSQQKLDELLNEGGTQLVTLGNRSFCLSKFNNQIYLTDNRCPHNGEVLHKGTLNAYGEIICPWHNYRFRLIDGIESQHRCGPLNTYRIELNNDGVFINV